MKKNDIYNDELGENHVATSAKTPLRADAFAISDDAKKERIQGLFTEIMDTLGLDLTDDSLKGTPRRVAKMFVDEVFSGLNPKNKPKLSVFDNTFNYNEMLVEKNITLYATCEHHFLPIIGVAHVAYFSSGKIIGLSKMNRIVDYFARRPQVQERLNKQIVEALQEALGTKDVACLIDATHLCVNSRGVRDTKSTTITAIYGGKFNDDVIKQEFLSHIQSNTNEDK